jgi:hypothetical protein
MTMPLQDVGCARLPAAALPALAEVRCASGVEVALDGGRAWVRWPAGQEEVLRRLLPVAGVQLYAWRDGRWHAPGCHLPAFEVPQRLEFRPLHQVLVPAPVNPVPAPAPRLQPARLELARDSRPRQTTALECGLAELAAWADAVPTARLDSLRAAHGQGRVLLLGPRLPLLPSGQRYWGNRLLVPLGYRPEPDLPESALRTALGVGGQDLLILRPGGPEVVPGSALGALTRAGIRLALREGS